MKRAVHPQLASKLHNVVADPDHQASTSPQASGKRKSAGNTTDKEAVRKKRKTVRKAYEPVVKDVLGTTRFIPTLQLFDAIWETMFNQLVADGEAETKNYLRAEYFESVALSNIAKIFPQVTHGTFGRNCVWLSGFWYGILGTYPGTGTGLIAQACLSLELFC